MNLGRENTTLNYQIRTIEILLIGYCTRINEHPYLVCIIKH